MSRDLFRLEAITANATAESGRPLNQIPPLWSWIAWLLVAFTVIAFIGMATLTYSRHEFVQGRLAPESLEAYVYAESPGVVQEVLVELGSSVRSGDVLAIVSTEQFSDSGIRIGAGAVEGLTRERASLDQREKTALASAELARTRQDAQIISLKRQIEGNLEAQRLVNQRVQIAQDRLESARRLEAQGASSREESRVREEALIAQRQQLADLEERAAGLQDAVHIAVLDRAKITDELNSQLADLAGRRAQIDQQVTRSLAQVGYSIVAPASGQIAALQVTRGDRIDASRPLLAIIPESSVLVAELSVPSRVVAQLAKGQRVQLSLDLTSASSQEAISGSITNISSAAFAPDDVRHPMISQEAAYKVIVALDDQISRLGDRTVSLQSGMSVSGIVLLDRRTILDWALRSLAPTARNSRRETTQSPSLSALSRVVGDRIVGSEWLDSGEAVALAFRRAASPILVRLG